MIFFVVIAFKNETKLKVYCITMKAQDRESIRTGDNFHLLHLCLQTTFHPSSLEYGLHQWALLPSHWVQTTGDTSRRVRMRGEVLFPWILPARKHLSCCV
jgi:hypothetical protein